MQINVYYENFLLNIIWWRLYDDYNGDDEVFEYGSWKLFNKEMEKN